MSDPNTGNLTLVWQYWLRNAGQQTASGVPSFSGWEIPTGVIDGNNATFTVKFTPNPPQIAMVEHNGQLVSTFTLNGKVFTMLAPHIPQPGDELKMWYLY